MNKEKQIEEMFNDVVEAEQRYHEYCLANTCHTCEYYGDGECDNHIRAEYLYTAGYRKQSEGEWLPSPDGIQPIRCSKCNMPAPFVAGENEFGDFEICRYPSRYCHECGAKMKGGAE